jgi:hypothetical protein
MILHCTLNSKPKALNGMKPLKIEFENKGGYWAKWFLCYDSKHAKELFKNDYPNGNYFRCKSY